MRAARVNKLQGRCETNIDVEGNLPQALKQAGKDHELLLQCKIAARYPCHYIVRFDAALHITNGEIGRVLPEEWRRQPS